MNPGGLRGPRLKHMKVVSIFSSNSTRKWIRVFPKFQTTFGVGVVKQNVHCKSSFILIYVCVDCHPGHGSPKCLSGDNYLINQHH